MNQSFKLNLFLFSKFNSLRYFVVILFSLFLNTQLSYASQGLLNNLLAPGPLMQDHKNLERMGCLNCHSAGAGIPNSKCLVCHTKIKKTLKNKKSFHGSRNKKCIICHTDHKGRKFDSVSFNMKTFNHNQTGYSLKGKHKKLQCNKCHTQTRKSKAAKSTGIRFLGVISRCNQCHQKNSPHQFSKKLKKVSCSKCHQGTTWKKDVVFNHFKQSKYKLEGKHKTLNCKTCHIDKRTKVAKYRWKNLNKNKCNTCHTNVHKNNFSRKFSKKIRKKSCNQCHSQKSWKIKRFKHSMTGFKLRGKHAKTKCLSCHKPSRKVLNKKDFKWKQVSSSCFKCHKDKHLFGTTQVLKKKRFSCARCHGFNSFKKTINFSHNFDTRFKLSGKHRKLSCNKCHKLINKRNPKTRIYHWKNLSKNSCIACHNNPHKRTFKRKLLKKRCTTCHSTNSWKQIRKNSKQFNHNFDTRFILNGKHARLRCDRCHKKRGKQIFKFKNARKQFCNSCHNPVHKKNFSKKFRRKSCSECHFTSTFKKIKKFNHSKTNFRLTGAHLKIANNCKTCHKSGWSRKRKVKMRNFKFRNINGEKCLNCHNNVHKKQFSQKSNNLRCTTCHITKKFRAVKQFNHKLVGFPIEGAHKKLHCYKCHKRTRSFFPKQKKSKKRMRMHNFKNLLNKQQSCKSCHKDTHNGNFGQSCKECHTPKKRWKKTADFHKNFPLLGVHFTLSCKECHQDNRRLGGLGRHCLSCHQKDDIHNTTLPNCQQCHQQNFWDITNFKHSLTLFPLRGTHRTLDCSACHSNGVYTGAPSECINCHSTDKARATSPPHNISGFENCSECHNQFLFK